MTGGWAATNTLRANLELLAGPDTPAVSQPVYCAGCGFEDCTCPYDADSPCPECSTGKLDKLCDRHAEQARAVFGALRDQGSLRVSPADSQEGKT